MALTFLKSKRVSTLSSNEKVEVFPVPVHIIPVELQYLSLLSNPEAIWPEGTEKVNYMSTH